MCIIRMAPVLVQDMQTLPSPSKRAVSIFLFKLLCNALKRIKNQFSELYFLNHCQFCPQFSSDQKYLMR